MNPLRLPVNALLAEYETRAYFRGRMGIFDVRPINCVRTASCLVVPIDVIPRIYGRQAASDLRRMIFQRP